MWKCDLEWWDPHSEIGSRTVHIVCLFFFSESDAQLIWVSRGVSGQPRHVFMGLSVLVGFPESQEQLLRDCNLPLIGYLAHKDGQCRPWINNPLGCLIGHHLSIRRWHWRSSPLINKLVYFYQQTQVSSVQNPCWLMIKGDYTTQFTGGYSNPIGESLLTNQYNGMIEGFWTLLRWL